MRVGSGSPMGHDKRGRILAGHSASVGTLRNDVKMTPQRAFKSQPSLSSASPDSLARIRARGLTKTFSSHAGDVHAVAGIDLEIQAGEIVAFLGPNGAGKTTTLDMVLGLTQPDSGEIEVLGLSPKQAIAGGKVSAVMQTGGLLRDLTVLETVQAIAALHNCMDRVADAMERANLTKIARRRVSKCSGGEQQRLKFALALLPNPDLIILDEPTAGMDVSARREFWAAMQEDADSGRTIVFATHYLEEAEAFAQRTVLVSEGKIIADGTTAHIRAIAAGRLITATITNHTDFDLAKIRGENGVQEADFMGTRLHVTTTDSDQLALKLLTEYEATDLEIQGPSLESTFLNLTAGATK